MTPGERAAGCLKGIATGDAVGKQSEGLSHEQVVRWYPGGIRGLEGAPGSTIPRYVGNTKHVWRVGETTDDTERTLAVARAIIHDRAVSHTGVGREMLACTKSIHPGVKSLWEFHQAADPARIAYQHDGCGAAIRVAPVGIFFTSGRLNAILDGARETSIPTHGGPLAIAAASAVAAAVSIAIDGARGPEVLEFAVRAATEAQARQSGTGEATFADAVRAIHDDLARRSALRPGELVARHFPSSPLTIVPLALGLSTTLHSAEEAILLAANIGGDSDSVASIAGGILGAMCPDTVNEAWCAVVEAVNQHGLLAIAGELSSLRQ